jgi:hypothetical protein
MAPIDEAIAFLRSSDVSSISDIVEMMHNALYDALCSLPYAVYRRLAH